MGILSRVGAVTHVRGMVYPRAKKSSFVHVASGASSSIDSVVGEVRRYIDFASGGREKRAVVTKI